MQNVTVHRYKQPMAHGWAGWIEPADKTWIAFVGLDGRPRFFLNRDPASGAILPDDPAEHAAHLASLRREGGTRIGMLTTSGEPCIPLGIDGTGGVGIPVATCGECKAVIQAGEVAHVDCDESQQGTVGPESSYAPSGLAL